MTREDLAREVAKKTSLNIKQAIRLAAAFGDTITETLEKGERIVYSNFGSFYTVHYPSKVIMHPKLGAQKKMIMLPTDVVKWMPSDNIKEAVDRGVMQDNCTSYGSFKKLHKDKPKAEEIEITPTKNTEKIEAEEEFIIPIKIISPAKSTESEAPQKIEIPPEETADAEEVIEIKKTEPPKVEVITESKEETKEETEDELLVPISRKEKKTKISFVNLGHFDIPSETLAIIPEAFAKNHRVVAIEDHGNLLSVAMSDPEDLETIHLLEKVTGRSIETRLADEAGVENALSQYSKLKDDNLIVAVEPSSDFMSTIGSEGRIAPITRTILNIIKKSLRDGATGIHFDPNLEEISVRFRIDGLLQRRTSLPKEAGNLLIRAFSLISSLDDDQLKPQTGKLKINNDNETYEYDLTTFPVIDGIKISMKLINKLTSLKNLGELELSGKNFSLIKDACIDRSGIILIAGPTDAGKNTLFYALLDQIYSEGINIVTIENPVKFRLPGISQTNIANPTEKENALEHIERLDPDVIGVTNIANKEMTEKTFELASNGHFLIITMAGSSVPEILKRLYDWGISVTKISELLKLVIFETLSRRLCDKCKREIEEPTEDRLRGYIAKELNISKVSEKIWAPTGCQICAESGFKGRLPLQEVVKIDQNIVKNAISGEISGYEESLKRAGLSTLREDGLDKVLRGQITLEELYKTIKQH